jgi:hypothetical protein
MRFGLKHEDVTMHTAQIRELFDFPELTMMLHSLFYGSSYPPRRPHDRVAPSTTRDGNGYPKLDYLTTQWVLLKGK